MAKINKEEYEILKGLDDEWKWLVRDKDRSLYCHRYYPVRGLFTVRKWHSDFYEELDETKFQFIQREDEEPYNIQELIEEYEENYIGSWEHAIEFSEEVFGESEETEVKTIESIQEEIWDEILYLEDKRKNQWADIKYQTLKELFQKLGHLEETEPKNISLQDVTHRLWELPLNSRKHWLEKLNYEFQEGYIVPLGLKTTDWEEQYLTFNGSYFACRRDKSLKQTFATLEEIPEFYRDLAERVL